MNIEQAKAYVQRVEHNPDLLKASTTLQLYFEAIKILQSDNTPSKIEQPRHSPELCEKCKSFCDQQMGFTMELLRIRDAQNLILEQGHVLGITDSGLMNNIEQLIANNTEQRRIIGQMKTNENNRLMHLANV
jgi:hypothetical protein